MRTLKFKHKIAWGTGEIGIAIYVGITMGFFPFYLTEAHHISAATAGWILLIPRLWDGITDPVMGAISDRTRSRAGRRRPYLLVGSLLYGATFWLFLAIPAAVTQTQTIVYLVAAYMLASTAMTIFDVPYSSMSAEMTTDYRERINLAGYKMVAARLGILIAGGIGPFLYMSGTDLLEGFAFMGAVFGLIMCVSGLITFFGTKDAPRFEQPASKFSFKKEFHSLISNGPFRILFSTFLFQNIAIGASATMLVYFLTFAMQMDGRYIGPLYIASGITATLVTPLWVKFSARMDKKTAYTIGLSIAIFLSLPGFFLPPGLFWVLIFLYAMIAIGDAANQLFPTSMAPDAVEVDQAKTGERREGTIFGAMAFCRKIGMAFGAFLALRILDASGFLGGGIPFDEQPENAILGVRIAYSLLPFTLWGIALIILRKYSLSESEFKRIQLNITDQQT